MKVVHRAVIGLGANLGDSAAVLREAARALNGATPDFADTRVTAASALYASQPVAAQGPDYLNAVLMMETPLSPEPLLHALLALEREHGRQRSVPNAPRTLDLDILLFNDQVLKQPGLSVPHPRLAQRRFVLEPLAEIAPDLRIPGLESNVRELLSQVMEQAVSKTALRLLD